MKKYLIIIILILSASSIFADFNWKTYKTDRFTLFYNPVNEQKALRLLEGIEYYAEFAEELVGNKKYNIPVFLEEFGQMPNYAGAANPVYYWISLSNNEYNEANMPVSIGLHEYVHILSLTQNSGLPWFLSMIVGDLASPLIYSPGWIIEGITTYSQYKAMPYTDRMHSGYYEAYLAACVEEGRMPDIMDATYSPNEAPGILGYYMFGGMFFKYLSEKYGDKKFAQFFSAFGDSIGSYFSPVFPFMGLDRTIDEVFGKVTTELWDEWLGSEKEKYKDYKQDGVRVTDHGWYTSTPVIYKDKMYYRKSISEKKGPMLIRGYNEIVEVDMETRRSKTVVSTTSSFNNPIRFDGDNMFYTVVEMTPGYANIDKRTYGGYSVLYMRDIVTGDTKELCRDEIRSFEIDGNRVIYTVEKANEFGSVVKSVDVDSRRIEDLFETPYLIQSMCGQNGRFFVSAREDNTNPDLFELDLKKKSLTQITDTPYQENNVSLYGRYLFFDGNYSGMHEPYAYDINSRKFFKLRIQGSGESPAYSEKTDQLFYVGLNTNGFDIYEKKAEFDRFGLPSVKYKEPLFTGKGLKNVKEGDWTDSLISLLPKVRSPIANFDSSGSAPNGAGYVVESTDYLNFAYSAQAMYNWEENRAMVNGVASTSVLLPLSVYAGYSNFYSERWWTGVSYPLYNSLLPGLQSIYASVEYMVYDYYKKDRITPAISGVFGCSHLILGIGSSMIFEPNYNYTDFDRTGYYSSAYLRHYLPYGNLFYGAKYYYDVGDVEEILPFIRGYSERLGEVSGTTLTFEYTFPLMQIRRGLWNPNIYIEDVFVKLFSDSQFSDTETFLSYGAELTFEMNTAFSALPFGITLFGTGNKSNDFSFGFRVGM